MGSSGGPSSACSLPAQSRRLCKKLLIFVISSLSLGVFFLNYVEPNPAPVAKSPQKCETSGSVGTCSGGSEFLLLLLCCNFLGGDAYFCNNIGSVLWLVCVSKHHLLIPNLHSFHSPKENDLFFCISRVCSSVHCCPFCTSPFCFFFLFPFHLCLIFHHDVVNSFFQLVLRFVLSIAM